MKTVRTFEPESDAARIAAFFNEPPQFDSRVSTANDNDATRISDDVFSRSTRIGVNKNESRIHQNLTKEKNMKLIDVMKQYRKAILRENAKLKTIYNTLIRESELDKDVEECDVEECDDVEEECPECGKELPEVEMMTAKEFFGEAAEEDLEPENENENEDEDVLISAKEFFGNLSETDDEVEENEQMTPEEFFEPVSEKEEDAEEDVSEEEDAEEDVSEEEDAEELNESKKYVKANRRLFNR